MNDDGASVSLFEDATPLASSIVDKGGRNEIRVEATTLDAELLKYDEPAVILIDVEGAETLVLRGKAVTFRPQSRLLSLNTTM